MSVSWAEQVIVLLDLQEIDAEIFKLESELSAQPVLIQKAQTLFESKKEGLKSAEGVLKDAQLRQRELSNSVCAF